MNNQISDKNNFERILDILCDGVNRSLDENKIIELGYKQKLLAISSFLEFIKAGADVKMEVGGNGKPTFVIKM